MHAPRRGNRFQTISGSDNQVGQHDFCLLFHTPKSRKDLTLRVLGPISIGISIDGFYHDGLRATEG